MLWKASNLLQRLHNKCLKELKVTPTQFSLMICLVYLHQDGPVTASRIVSHTGMDKMMVSDLIKALEKKRLIRKKANPEDGRSSIIEPTRSGERATNSAVREVETVDGEFFRRVNDIRIFHADLIALVSSEATELLGAPLA